MNDLKIFALMKEEKIKKIQSKHSYFTRNDIEAGFIGLDFDWKKAVDACIERISGRSIAPFYNRALGKEYE